MKAKKVKDCDPLTRVEAVRAIHRCCFVTNDADDDQTERIRSIVHCYVRGIGADWDVEAAIRFVLVAEKIMWRETMFGLSMVVHADDKAYLFDTVVPS